MCVLVFLCGQLNADGTYPIIVVELDHSHAAEHPPMFAWFTSEISRGFQPQEPERVTGTTSSLYCLQQSQFESADNKIVIFLYKLTDYYWSEKIVVVLFRGAQEVVVLNLHGHENTSA